MMMLRDYTQAARPVGAGPRALGGAPTTGSVPYDVARTPLLNIRFDGRYEPSCSERIRTLFASTASWLIGRILGTPHNTFHEECSTSSEYSGSSGTAYCARTAGSN